MKIVIVDDEPLARSRLARLLEEIPDAQVLGEAANGLEAIRLASDLHPDVLLLDIRMPEMDGIEVARHLSALENPPAIIFTTAFDSHAIAAFQAQATGYLLKPIRKEHLHKALEAARRLNRAQLAQLNLAEDEEQSRSHISIHTGSRLKLIPVSDIFYFQAEQKYVTVRHRGGQSLIEEPLKALEEEFSSSFIRIHRNALVALAHVSGMRKDASGQHYLALQDCEEELEVSRRHVSEVRARLKGVG